MDTIQRELGEELSVIELEKELLAYKQRVALLTGYIHFLRVNEYESEELRLDALDVAYNLSNELSFNEGIIYHMEKSVVDNKNKAI